MMRTPLTRRLLVVAAVAAVTAFGYVGVQGAASSKRGAASSQSGDAASGDDLTRLVNDAVAVLPYDPVADAVLLIEQFRIGTMLDLRSPWSLEPIAGIIEAGETIRAFPGVKNAGYMPTPSFSLWVYM